MTEASDYLLQLAGLMNVSADALAGMTHVAGIDGQVFDVIELSLEVRDIAARIQKVGEAVSVPSRTNFS